MFSQSQPVARQASAKITGEGGLSDHPSLCIGHSYCAMSSKRKESVRIFFVHVGNLKCLFKSLFFIIFCHALKMNTYFDVLNNILKHI